MSDAAIIAAAEHCPNLTSLNIVYCENISDLALLALGQHSHALKSIDISTIRNITDEGIAALAAGCPLLQECRARETRFADAGLIALAKSCLDLSVVDLYHCTPFNITAISTLAEDCPLISYLDLSSNHVNDAYLESIAKHCCNLAFLNVCITTVSIDGVAVLLRSCRHLRRLKTPFLVRRKMRREFPHIFFE